MKTSWITSLSDVKRPSLRDRYARALLLLLPFLAFLPFSGYSADILMKNGAVISTCSDNFYSSNGSSGYYSSMEDYTLTIYPSIPGAKVTVDFTSFYLEDGYDYLNIYDGSTTGAPHIGEYTGGSSPGTVTSTADDGSLTFHFYSDEYETETGWEATVSCGSLSACSGTALGGTAVAAITSICPGKPAVISLDGFTTGTGVTYQWDTSSSGTGGWGAVAGATSVPLMWAPPTGSTLYYRCTVTCTSSGSSDVSSSVVISVSEGGLPYFEDFESTPAYTLPECTDATFKRWDGFEVHDYETWPSLDNHTPGGTNYLYAGYYLGMASGTPDFFFTPAFGLEPGKTYQFSFWYKTDGYGPYLMGAYYGTEQTKGAMTNAIAADLYPNNTDYQEYVNAFTVSTAGNYHIGIKISQDSWASGMAIDDIGLIELPPCSGTPSSAGVANAAPPVICSSPGSTTLSLGKLPAVSGLTFQWYEASSLGGPYTAISGATTNPYEHSGITGISYYYCEVGCDAGGSTLHSDTVSIKVAPLTPPYIEDFESGTSGVNLPCAEYTYGWDKYNYWYLYGSAHPWEYPLDNHTPGGSKWLFAGAGLGPASGGEPEYWFTPGLALTAGKAYNFSYWYNTDGYVPYEFGARFGTSQDKSAMTGLIGTDIKDNNTTYNQFSGDFVIGSTGTYYIGIRFKATDWYSGGAIDDIGLTQLPPCAAKPSAGTASAMPGMVCAPGESGTELTLKGLSAASDLVYQWQEATALTGPWTDISGATAPSLSTDPLTTEMYYRCIVTCPLVAVPNKDTSDPVHVLMGPLHPPYREDFETATAGINQPCASNTSTFESSTSTSNYYWWGMKDMPGLWYPSLDNHTAGGSKYLSAGTNIGTYSMGSPDGDLQYWFTPAIQLTGGMAYKCSYWYVGGSREQAATFGLYYGTSQSASAMNAMRPDVTGENNTSYNYIEGFFTAPTTGLYYLGVKVNITKNAWYGVAIDDIGLEQLPPCAAKPTAGTVTSLPTLICSSGSAKMSLLGTSMASRLTFQWQQAPAEAGPWTNVSTGSGGTTAMYTSPSLIATTWYRCIVTCPLIAAPNADTSAAYEMRVGPLTPPYIETFETGTEGSNMPCAANTHDWNTYSWYIYGTPFDSYYPAIDNHTPGGKKYLYSGSDLYWAGGTPYWFSPGIRFTSGATYEFSFWYNGSGSSSGATTIGMYYGPNQSTSGLTAVRADLTGVNTTTYKQMTGRFIAPATGTYYLALKVRHTSSGSYPGVVIDDIGLNQLPPCTGIPTAGALSVMPSMLCSAGSVNLDMDMAGVTKAAGLSYRWEWTTTDPGSAFLPSGSSAVLMSPTYTSPAFSTTTWVRCIVKCTATGDSVISSYTKVDVGVIIPPYIETFETGIPGTNMPCASYSGGWNPGYYWYLFGSPYDPYYPTADNHTPGGSKYLLAGYGLGYSWGIPGASYWFTPAIKFTAGKLYQFSMWYNGTGYTGANTTLGVYYGTSQSAAAMTTAIAPDMTVNTTAYKLYAKRFTATATGNYYIGIKVQHPTSYSPPGLSIDDIGLQEVPPCSSTVVAGSISPEPAHICSVGGSTILDLSGATLATGLSYEWFSATSATGPYTYVGAGLPFATPALSGNTWFRTVVTCIASGEKDTTDPFEMKVGAFDLPYSEDFESTVPGTAPLCSDATLWGAYFYDGWRVVSGGSYSNHTPGGRRFLIGGTYLGSPTSPSTENYWFTPGFKFMSGYKYQLSFYYIGSDGYNTSRMGVYYGGSQTASAMTNVIAPFRNYNNSSYKQLDTTFTIATTGVYYLGFRKSGINPASTYSYEGVAFDDINLNYAPCDGMPVAGIVSGLLPSGTGFCNGTYIRLANSGATISLVPGIRYQWERREIPSGTWKAIPGATDSVISGDTLIGYEYRTVVVCTNTNDTARSAPFAVPALPPHPPVGIMPSASPVTFCLGDTMRFTATNFVGAVYDWMRDSMSIPGWKFSDLGATEPGKYMVKVTSALSPCPAYSPSVTLIQNDPGYKVDITTPSDSFLCDGEFVVLTGAGSKPGLSYQWRKDNVDIPFATGTTYPAAVTGYYRIVATDGISSCPAVSRNVLVTVRPNPPAVISIPGGTLTACADVGVKLDANLGGYSYQWNRGGSPVFGWVDSSVTITSSGVYSVKVRTPDGCVSVSSEVSVTILPSPEPIINKVGSFPSISLNATPTSFVSYVWKRMGASGVTTEGTGITLSPVTKKGTYTVTATDVNGCVGTSGPIEIMDDGLNIPGAQTAEIRLYPNPTEARVFIESPVKVQVEVKDVTGKTVYQRSGETVIDLSKFADGVYLFLISDEQGGQLLKQQRINKVTAK